MSHFIVNRFEKIQKSTRVLYVILEFLRKLFVKVRPNHDSHFDSSSSSLGRSSFLLSYSSILSKQHTAELFAGEESEQTFTVSRLNANVLYSL